MRARTFWAIIALCLAGLVVIPRLAAAHQAPSGASYLPECCDGRDCAPVRDPMVEDLGGGHVRMTIRPGTHPMWGADRAGDLVMDFGPQHRRPALDGSWHGCFGPGQNPLCYHPPMRSF